MPRVRRQVISNCMYEVCFRAKESIPLVSTEYMKLLISSILARTQRDHKVVICHDIWNGSHPHIILVTKDSQQLINFVSEVQKKLTDSIKRLLGVKKLNIWEGRANIARIYDIETAISRIGYVYANPAQDDLEENIEKFPGYSSYRDFINAESKLSAKHEKLYPWIRLHSIPKLTNYSLTTSQDRKLVMRLKNKNRSQSHILTREPNAWMKCFGVEFEEDIKDINDRIIKNLRIREKEALDIRAKEKKSVMGATALRTQPLMKPHTPKKNSIKINVLSSCNEIRKEAIKAFAQFCNECRRCYLAWKAGDFSVVWPPGAFKPPIPPLYNAIV